MTVLPDPLSYTVPFRPAPFVINPAKNYRNHRIELEFIDELITRSGLDDLVIRAVVDERRKNTPEGKDPDRGLQHFISHVRTGFRAGLLRAHLGTTAVRDLEIRLADSPLYQWFCFIDNFGGVKAPSKSTIDRYKNLFTDGVLDQAFQHLLRQAAEEPEHLDPDLEILVNTLGFEIPSNLLEVWYDTTCLAPNIHFPVDWVQLSDASRTLLKAIRVIRKHGLKNRLPKDPEKFLRKLNQISINLGNARRRIDSKKRRKEVFRQLKGFTDRVVRHARKHRDLLKVYRERDTDLSAAQAKLVIDRIDRTLGLLPVLKKQAHERIIGGRRFPAKEKILSNHEPTTRVIVRGKSGAEVEFGNPLLIGENREGLITHWELFEDVANDNKVLPAAVAKTEETIGGLLELICGDRGFSDEKMEEKFINPRPGLANHITPKSPARLREKLKDPAFAASQKRRAQTEARIGIITNNYQPGRSLSKGLDSRRQELRWIMLAHNLRGLARKRLREQAAREASQKKNRRVRKAPPKKAA
jgi:hypothetical protein